MNSFNSTWDGNMSNNYGIQASNAEPCVSSLTTAKGVIKEHIAMVDRSIIDLAANENYEACAELKMVRKGLEYAIEDVSSCEMSGMMDDEYVELPKPIFELFQRLSASVNVNKDLIKITMDALLLCDATFSASHDALAALAGRSLSPMECHNRIEALRMKFLNIRHEMDAILKKVGAQ